MTQHIQFLSSDQQGQDTASFNHSLSVILPAYNEEHAIASTVNDVLAALTGRIKDFEVIVVNDGSADRTGTIVESIAHKDSRVRLLTHAVNQGYGATLADGFAAATKELTFFMDSDGQFDIRDLFQFFPSIDEYDAVLGYRIQRQDTWMRKLNAWGWKMLIGIVLGVHVRDIDCAFKLLHTDFSAELSTGNARSYDQRRATLQTEPHRCNLPANRSAASATTRRTSDGSTSTCHSARLARTVRLRAPVEIHAAKHAATNSKPAPRSIIHASRLYTCSNLENTLEQVCKTASSCTYATQMYKHSCSSLSFIDPASNIIVL